MIINSVLEKIVTNSFYSIPNLFLMLEKQKESYFFLIEKSPKRESALSEESHMTIAQSSVTCEIPVKPDQ